MNFLLRSLPECIAREAFEPGTSKLSRYRLRLAGLGVGRVRTFLLSEGEKYGSGDYNQDQSH